MESSVSVEVDQSEGSAVTPPVPKSTIVDPYTPHCREGLTRNGAAAPTHELCTAGMGFEVHNGAHERGENPRRTTEALSVGDE